MNGIDKRTKLIRKEKRIGLMTHMIVGYPSLGKTAAIARAMERGGADFIEMQIPFSDPIADGPTIMVACEKSLHNGTTTRKALAIASKLTPELHIPIILMAYYNTVFRYGVGRFCADAKKAGVAGLIVPDVPIEEEHEEHFIRSCNKNGLYGIRVVSPSSTDERLRKNAKIGKGFIYCTARQSITGARKDLDPAIASYLKRVSKISKVPVAVGFGISKRKQIETLSKHADIAIVGSAIIDAINRNKKGSVEKTVEGFVMELAGRKQKLK